MDEYDVMNRGTVIVMDVNSGAVLSMATLEQFDPNNPYTIEDPDLVAVLEDSTLTAEEIDLLQSRLGEITLPRSLRTEPCRTRSTPPCRATSAKRSGATRR